jgi:hypothetical protein
MRATGGECGRGAPFRVTFTAGKAELPDAGANGVKKPEAPPFRSNMDDDAPLVIVEHEGGWIIPLLFGGVMPEGNA